LKPVVIFRHACCENAGYFGAFLKQRNIPWDEVRLDLNVAIPQDVSAYSGVVLMGGPMSVNDDLPWIQPTLNFIQSAFTLDIPVLGHCLGGQLMSKALGAAVTQNPMQEIGWGKVDLVDHPLAKRWFGDDPDFLSFHWHSETFDLPDGATHLLSSAHCRHQAYAIGKHLAMQCHIEITQEMIAQWCEVWLPTLQSERAIPSIQTYEQINERIQAKVKSLNMQAHYTYSQWAKGLVL
jgi:GMP synthase-like glutamine amidotransferase